MCCVLELGCSSARVVSGLPAETQQSILLEHVLQKHWELSTGQSGVHRNSIFFKMKVVFVLAYTVMLLVKALHYKPEDRGFDSYCCYWDVTLT